MVGARGEIVCPGGGSTSNAVNDDDVAIAAAVGIENDAPEGPSTAGTASGSGSTRPDPQVIVRSERTFNPKQLTSMMTHANIGGLQSIDGVIFGQVTKAVNN